jgi:hypothetical protein
MAGRKFKTEEQISAEGVYQLLKVRYPIPSWALLPQVGNTTGSGVGRWADAVAMSCWPSLGLKFIGFEIKVSRGDWLGEIRNGEKSNAIFKFCDYWYIVVSEESIVQPGELPPTWGLLAAKGGRLHCITEAPMLQPQEFTKGFVASILRNTVECATPEARLKAEYERGLEEGRKDGQESGSYGMQSLQEKHDRLLQTLTIFEKKTGLKWPYHEYWKSDEDAKLFSEAVKLVMHTDRHRALKEILSLKDKMAEVMKLIDQAVDESKTVIAAPKESRRQHARRLTEAT